MKYSQCLLKLWFKDWRKRKQEVKSTMNQYLGDCDKFTKDNMRLVYKIAYRYRWAVQKFHGQIEFNDLVQIGSVGLVQAYNKFDPTRFSGFKGEPIKFSSYAIPLIQGNIQRFLREYSPGCKIPRPYLEKIYQFIKTGMDINSPLELICAEMNCTEDEAKKLILAYNAYQVDYLDRVTSDVLTLKDSIAIDQAMDEGIILNDFLHGLKPKEYKIYELMVARGLTQRETAEITNYSQAYVSRIFSKILKAAREYGGMSDTG